MKIQRRTSGEWECWDSTIFCEFHYEKYKRNYLFESFFYVSVILPKNSVLLPDISSLTLTILNSGRSNYFSNGLSRCQRGVITTSTQILHSTSVLLQLQIFSGQKCRKILNPIWLSITNIIMFDVSSNLHY